MEVFVYQTLTSLPNVWMEVMPSNIWDMDWVWRNLPGNFLQAQFVRAKLEGVKTATNHCTDLLPILIMTFHWMHCSQFGNVAFLKRAPNLAYGYCRNRNGSNSVLLLPKMADWLMEIIMYGMVDWISRLSKYSWAWIWIGVGLKYCLSTFSSVLNTVCVQPIRYKLDGW